MNLEKGGSALEHGKKAGRGNRGELQGKWGVGTEKTDAEKAENHISAQVFCGYLALEALPAI